MIRIKLIKKNKFYDALVVFVWGVIEIQGECLILIIQTLNLTCSEVYQKFNRQEMII